MSNKTGLKSLRGTDITWVAVGLSVLVVVLIKMSEKKPEAVSGVLEGV
jgi:hypothetical protein